MIQNSTWKCPKCGAISKIGLLIGGPPKCPNDGVTTMVQQKN